MRTIFKIQRNRDRALLLLGKLYPRHKGLKVNEGYLEFYEGDKRTRGLPFVEIRDTQICYRNM